MAKNAAAPIERMAGSKPHKGRQIALEIVTFILFLLFMMPFIIVVFNSMRTNQDIINQPVALPTDLGQFWTNITDIWNNPGGMGACAQQNTVVKPALHELCCRNGYPLPGRYVPAAHLVPHCW